MRNLILDIPSFGFVVGTRVALAFGAGLLAAARIPDSRRRTIGLALVALGVGTTIPAGMAVVRGFGGQHRRRVRANASTIERDRRLIGAHRFPRKGDDDAD